MRKLMVVIISLALAGAAEVRADNSGDDGVNAIVGQWITTTQDRGQEVTVRLTFEKDGRYLFQELDSSARVLSSYAGDYGTQHEIYSGGAGDVTLSLPNGGVQILKVSFKSPDMVVLRGQEAYRPDVFLLRGQEVLARV